MWRMFLVGSRSCEVGKHSYGLFGVFKSVFVRIVLSRDLQMDSFVQSKYNDLGIHRLADSSLHIGIHPRAEFTELKK